MRRTTVMLTVMALSSALVTLAAVPGDASQAVRRQPTAVARPFATVVPGVRFGSPPTTAQCQLSYGFPCYQPGQIEAAYDMSPLYQQHLTGTGETIALVDSYGSPTIASDLATFDSGFGLPAPPKLSVITPEGAIPPFDPSNPTMVGWAEEATLDVEYAHAMAPGADLLLVETPVAETIGVQGFPQMVAAENHVIDDGLAQVISQSFGAAEQTFPTTASLLALRTAYTNAQSHHVSVLAAAGDDGSTSASNAAGTRYFTSPVANWPATDPLVTAVGGTQLHLGAKGARLRPDNVWNDTTRLGELAAGGGGTSSVFARPTWQQSVASVVGDHRGMPDVSLSAAVVGSVLIYSSFSGAGSAGYYLIGGTSEATPLFAGVVAVADQAAGHPLGFLNPTLYRLAAAKSPGLVDVTLGDNTVSFAQGAKTVTVPGYHAAAGYDLASGLGTVDGSKLVNELAAAGS